MTYKTLIGALFLSFGILAGSALPAAAQDTSKVSPAQAGDISDPEDIFEDNYRNGLVMQIEAAIARAQADVGDIPQAAADEIAAKASPDYAPLEDIEAEYDIVRHRMVALLNVWRRQLSPEAGDALHKGVTTVDIYDTVLTLQLLQTTDLMLEDLWGLEAELLCLADTHKDTPMIGRTLGQHALPITFGKKAAGWAALTRRNIDRIYELRARLRQVGVLKGAVGTHLGLGPNGREVEIRTSGYLGLDTPSPADERASRDVFGEYAVTMALMSRSYANMGNEIFHLQMTDIGEVYERRVSTAVGSSTMPHKRNPSLSERLVHYGRVISAQSDILLEDMINHFERDNTSRPNRSMEALAIESVDMISDARRLIGRLEVYPDRMRENIDRTDGMVMAQRLVLYLGEQVSREEAEMRVRDAANRALDEGVSFETALLDDPVIGPRLDGQLSSLMDPAGYLGQASEQVDRTRDWISAERVRRGEPELGTCQR